MKTAKEVCAISAMELCGGIVPSEAHQRGRLLKMRFVEERGPVLQRIEYRHKTGAPSTFLQRSDAINNLTWQQVSQALSMVFLEYVRALALTPTDTFEYVGSQRKSFAASLGDAITNPEHGIHYLLAEIPEPYPLNFKSLSNKELKPYSRVLAIFSGQNLHGKVDEKRRIRINPEFLPPDCIEVFLEGKERLTKLEDIHDLVQRIRKSLDLEPLPDLPVGEEVGKKTTTPTVQRSGGKTGGRTAQTNSA